MVIQECCSIYYVNNVIYKRIVRLAINVSEMVGAQINLKIKPEIIGGI